MKNWRSLLFTPAHIERFLTKVNKVGADAVVLDLEKSVPLASKAEARKMICRKKY